MLPQKILWGAWQQLRVFSGAFCGHRGS